VGFSFWHLCCYFIFNSENGSSGRDCMHHVVG
jgi:hypothetical protein